MTNYRVRGAAFLDTAWALACELEVFRYVDIWRGMHCGRQRSDATVRHWEALGLIVREDNELNCLTFRVLEPRREIAFADDATFTVAFRLKGTAEGNMWRAMRGLRTFTARDLAAHATTPDIHVPVGAAETYVEALCAAGYVKVDFDGGPFRASAYRLVRLTTGRAPRVIALRAVVDDDTGQIVHVLPLDRAVEEAA